MSAFAIPPDLIRSMQASVTTARNEKKKPDELTDSVKNQGLTLDVVTSIDPKLWKFSGVALLRLLYDFGLFFSQFVGALTGFYDIKSKVKSWIQDRKWLEQVDWRKIDADVHLFALETKTAGMSSDAVSDHHQLMANELIVKFTSSRLRTEFATISDSATISFENIVGGLCREVREGLRSFLSRWHIANTSDSEITFDPIDWVEVLQQPDLSSCGAMVVAQVHNYVTGNLGRQHYQVTKKDVKVMRLRMLRTIMCYSQERPMPSEYNASVAKIHQQLLKQL
ncbi:hypothetical protein ON010_g162 [Phytophthora cinnamomi]|nr:hypothetical protein ON010_g162 [Phytophthora cinnamomi]